MYTCDNCNFKTNIQSNYDKHIQTMKHLNNIINIRQKIIQKNNDYSCKYCGQLYKHKSSIYKHIKYNCMKNKDEDLKELVRLLNLKLEQKDKEIEIHQKQKDNELEIYKKQIECQTKQIDKLMSKLEINGSFNTTNNIQNNIQLLAYKDTDISHLTENDYMFCIKKVNFCVKNLIEKIHFNSEKPENMNIYISNLKDKYMMIYEEGNWNIKNKSELDILYQEKEMMLEQWLNEEQDKYPELKEKFIRYLNNKENDETLNMIKDEIKLMMYNNKKSIKAS
jgi:hypothetical protein